MPHISRHRLKKEFEEQLLRSLTMVLTKINTFQDTHELLLSLLSPTEQLMIAKRLAIIVLLKEELPENKIANTLHVTRETVARMRLFLELHERGFNIALTKLDNEKYFEEFKKLLISLTRYSLRASGGYVKSPFTNK